MLNSGHTTTPADASLTLTTLGGAKLALSGGRELRGAGKPLALLVYLASSPRRTATREHLLDLLWSDLPAEKGRHALRQIIWYLRQALGDDAIQSRGSEIALELPLHFDREEFLRAIAEGDADRAITLYGGDFLTGFAAPGGADFEHWADLEREQLRTVFLRTGESLARQWLRDGRMRDAQALARRLRDTAPRHEAAWRLLLETLVAGGDTLALTLETAALEQSWRSEDRELEPTTRALLGRIAGAIPEPDAGPPTGLLPELVGREPEFAALLAAWEQARRGRTIHLHLSGAAGLGKSRLLTDAQRRLRGLGAPVVALRATPAQRQIAYGFLGELVRAVSERPGTAAISPASAGSLVALHPSLSERFATPLDAAGGEEALRRRTAALTELLTVAADEAPFALLLDDMHWLDNASRQVLSATLERLERTPILCVTAARHGTGFEVLTPIRLDLQPLVESDVARLIASLGALPDEAWASSLAGAVHRTADGIPLLVLETLQLALDRGHLQLTSGQWGCPAPAELAHQLRGGSALRTRIAALSAEDRWFLLILAVAGTALSATELTAVGQRERIAVEEILARLEQKGFLRRLDDRWLPSHDEVATSATDLASEEARLRAHAGLGRAIAESAEARGVQLIQAAYHLAAAGRKAEVIGLFARHLGQVRRQGDGRRVGAVAYEFLGEGAAPSEVRSLVRGLPPWSRVRWSSAHNVAAVATLIGAAAFAASRTGDAPDARLLIGESPAGLGTRGHEVKIDLRTWQAGVAIAAGALRSVPPPPGGKNAKEFILSPDGRSALIVRDQPPDEDSTTSDIYLRDPSGAETRLTRFRHDDGNPDWAPDQSAMVFFTSRYSPPEADNYDLAIMDLRTHTIRQLTSGRGADHSPKYSPDGSRIGFHRFSDERFPTFCWVPQDGGTAPACPELKGLSPIDLVGWIDDNRVLLTADTSGARTLVSYSLATGAVRTLDHAVLTALLSPDRNWVAVWRDDAEDGGDPRLFVYPVDNPGRARQISAVGVLPLARLVWLSSDPHPTYLARVDVHGPADNQIPVSGTTRLRARGVDPSGADRPIAGRLRWSSSDSATIAVDSTGLAHPRRLGSAMISAELSGWRRDSIRLTVVPAGDSIVLREDWSGTITGQWIPFGDPRPALYTRPDGVRGFWNRGDGSYASGAYTRQHWTASEGLGAEVRVSIPLSRGQWQVGSIELSGGFDSLHLAGWDHRTGTWPSNPAGDPRRNCGLSYPSGEGPLGRVRIGIGGPGGAQFPVDSGLGNGEWITMRLQIFPDGRCGMALNGLPLRRPTRPLKLDLPFALRLGSAAAGAYVLHGPVEIWQGVRTDIDWDALDTSRAALAGAGRPR